MCVRVCVCTLVLVKGLFTLRIPLTRTFPFTGSLYAGVAPKHELKDASSLNNAYGVTLVSMIMTYIPFSHHVILH